MFSTGARTLIRRGLAHTTAHTARTATRARSAVAAAASCLPSSLVSPSSAPHRAFASSLSYSSSASSSSSSSAVSFLSESRLPLASPRPLSSPLVLPLRTLFIQTHTTPNPRSLKFVPGRAVLETDTAQSTSFDASNRGLAKRRSPQLAYPILLVEGVQSVMLGADFVTVTVDEGTDWMVVKPQVFAAISDHFATDQPALVPESPEEAQRAAAAADPATTVLPNGEVIRHREEDAEAIALIREIIEMRIRPSVMEDGGDVDFIKFDENRIVWLLMKGSCSGCPSSGATLKHGIQNMLMHYVPEVAGVEEWVDVALQTVSEQALRKLEASLDAAKHPEPATALDAGNQQQQQQQQTSAAATPK